MKYTISGKNIEVTEGLRTAVYEKLGRLEKYFNDEFDSLGELNKNQKLEEIKLNFNNSIKLNKIIIHISN